MANSDPFYSDETMTLWNGDATEIVPGLELEIGCLVVDPPWDRPDLMEWASTLIQPATESVLVFTDGRRFRDPIRLFGAPDWVFTWDTRNTWSVSKSSPVQQTKHCLYYGASYDRDAELWGDPPPARTNPTTKQVPLDGRRLTDLWSESLRWLHNPTAGRKAGGRGSDRHRSDGNHAKPIGWIRCLVGNTSTGIVLDPFVGSGSTLRACKDLHRPVVGVELDPDLCKAAIELCGQEVLPI